MRNEIRNEPGRGALEGDEPRRQNHFRKIASLGGGQLGPFGTNLLHWGLLVRVPGGAPT